MKFKLFMEIFSKNLKEASGPGKYSVNTIQIQCILCKNDRFIKSKAKLNTAILSFLNLDWADNSATTLTCDKCGYIMFFDNNKINRN